MKKLIKPLNITIDNKLSVPVYDQVKQAIKWSILSGYLEDNDQLPSLRELATMLHINPNTIVKIYFQLEVEGFIRSVTGSGFFVCKKKDLIAPQGRELFDRLSQEYIAKVIALGFSEQTIIEYLHSKTPMPLGAASSAKEIKNGND